MTINLQAFCAKDDVRSYLMTPFVLDGHTCATNGYILIRVPGGKACDEVMVAAGVRKMFGEQYADFVPLPTLPERAPCEHCEGTGTECGDDSEHCLSCRGSGESLTFVQIGDANFQARYLRMIAALPNARISVKSAEAVAAFMFDGGDGRLMPCRP